MSVTDLGKRWTQALNDTETTAAEYRDRGWDAIAVHPGDVNPIVDAARLHVLLPGSEFDAVNERLSGASIDSVGVYGADDGSVLYRLLVVESAEREIAVCVPTFVRAADVDDLEAAVAERGALGVRLRPLDDRDHVEFTVDTPDLFFRSPTDE